MENPLPSSHRCSGETLSETSRAPNNRKKQNDDDDDEEEEETGKKKKKDATCSEEGNPSDIYVNPFTHCGVNCLELCTRASPAEEETEEMLPLDCSSILGIPAGAQHVWEHKSRPPEADLKDHGAGLSAHNDRLR